MPNQKEARDFIQQVEQAQQGLLREFWELFRYNKKWWLTPIVLGLLLVGFMLFLASTAVAPFIYTIF
jgi:Family of unknown function (DUF5989)